MPSLSMDFKHGSPKVVKLLTALQDRIKYSKQEYSKFHERWMKDEERALAYMPEKAVDAFRRVEREQEGIPHYTTIQIPYTYAILMASHTYWTSVFMGRYPVHQFAGRHGEGEQQIMALEAMISYQTQVGQHLVPYYIWLLDAGKYGVGILGEYWEDEIAYVSQVVEEEVKLFGRVPTGKTRKLRRNIEVPGFSGNRVYTVRPYDFYPDPRVTMANFQKGEFVGIYNEIGWNQVVLRAKRGFYNQKVVENIPASDRESGANERISGSPQLSLPVTDNPFGVLARDKKAGDVLKVYEVYIELIPKDWDLGAGEMPQKWVFTCSSDFKWLIGAQPLGALHNQFPFSVLEMEPEGYSLIGRSIPRIVEPVQNTMDWLINTHFYNVRKILKGRYVADPSKIIMKDLLGLPDGGVIRMRPSAYGQDPRLAVHQLEATDVTRSHLTDLQVMLDMGQRATGVNDTILGMLNVRGRRTAQETRTSTTFGVNRLKTQAEYMSAMGWAPHAQRLVQNSQQYYSAERKFRIVGDLALEAGQMFTDPVTPDMIAGFYDFVPVDGTLPADRFAQANLWRELLAGLRQMPDIAMRYDVGRIFGWVAQLAGLKNIHQFRIDVQSDEDLARQAERGNVVPMPSEGSRRDMERVGEPGQVRGMGTTG